MCLKGLDFCLGKQSYWKIMICRRQAFSHFSPNVFGNPLCQYNFNTQSQLLMTLKKKTFANIVGKGENAANQHFLLFRHNVFYQLWKVFLLLSYIYFVVCKCFQFRPV